MRNRQYEKCDYVRTFGSSPAQIELERLVNSDKVLKKYGRDAAKIYVDFNRYINEIKSSNLPVDSKKWFYSLVYEKTIERVDNQIDSPPIIRDLLKNCLAVVWKKQFKKDK